MAGPVIHKCPIKNCRYKKKCFVCKTEEPVVGNVVVLHKCVVTKEDIPVNLGMTEDDLCTK